MAIKTKFKYGDQATANKKAPLYLRKRQENGEIFTVSGSLGEGKYRIICGPNEDIFDVQSSHLDLVETPASGVTETTFNQVKETLEANAKPAQPKLSAKVQEFVDSQNAEIDKIKDKIRPQMDQMTERAIISALAMELNQVPSPPVFRLMNQLLEVNPDLGHLDTLDLYKKAEGILEFSLEKR